MTFVKPTPYKDIGMQIRAIREKLKVTLDDLNRETGISRSYISDFERGIKLPTAKFLRYLHNTHNINLNFIFLGDGHMFRPLKEDVFQADFGKFQDEIEEILTYAHRMPHALFALLGFFMEYKVHNKKLIEEFFSDKKKE